MGVLAVLTVVPGPDMAVMTKRTVSSGRQDGLRSVGGITAGPLIRDALTVAGPAVPSGNAWRTGLVSNVLNPKIAIFRTGLLPTLAPSGLCRGRTGPGAGQQTVKAEPGENRTHFDVTSPDSEGNEFRVIPEGPSELDDEGVRTASADR